MSTMMNLEAAASAVGGALRGPSADFSGVSTDSRKIAAGELFVALRGENFDGHAFVAAVHDDGLAACHFEAGRVIVELAREQRLHARHLQCLGHECAHTRRDEDAARMQPQAFGGLGLPATVIEPQQPGDLL